MFVFPISPLASKNFSATELNYSLQKNNAMYYRSMYFSQLDVFSNIGKSQDGIGSNGPMTPLYIQILLSLILEIYVIGISIQCCYLHSSSIAMRGEFHCCKQCYCKNQIRYPADPLLNYHYSRIYKSATGTVRGSSCLFSSEN